MEDENVQDALLKELAGLEYLLVSYSGGIDSTLLALFAQKVLQDKVKCVLFDAPLVPRRAIKEAKKNARKFGLSCSIIPFPILENEEFRKNSPNRCYICKKQSARILKDQAEKLGISKIADGINASDLDEYRPGLQASNEEGILHPFLSLGIQKKQIRQLAQECGFDFWNKPSASCLASRIPYGEEITVEKLQIIEHAEDLLHDLGFSNLRVRLHGKIARIELLPEEFEKGVNMRDKILEVLQDCGFSYIALDLKGYRSGSLDEVL
ncbi:ATP-utilizing enzymes of the PP-loop superfamily [Methanosarcina barkeri 3]|uniref:ATP-utilizing enzymes of the PP-loop superfamily n=1 Tax=Methanosarcina barkeri 3 TaxID=1434107 RepID=A0A0E3SL42_METBA|nr:ATP-dependent sacrificial sulfur transferase LarE [Methanosarcina barkeri]AKB81413.1 ATP-utilizing enzymes of the PP-loop superfamily [Methanosarcina barkeri 3]